MPACAVSRSRPSINELFANPYVKETALSTTLRVAGTACRCPLRQAYLAKQSAPVAVPSPPASSLEPAGKKTTLRRGQHLSQRFMPQRIACLSLECMQARPGGAAKPPPPPPPPPKESPPVRRVQGASLSKFAKRKQRAFSFRLVEGYCDCDFTVAAP